MNQNQMILDYIEKNGSITALDAVYKLGVTRLSARVYDLNNAGFTVKKAMERGTNRFGEEVNFARYYLEKAV